MLTKMLFVTSFLFLSLGYAAPPPNVATEAHQPGPPDLADTLLGRNNLLRRHLEFKAQGWQLLAPGMVYKFSDDGVESQVGHLDMDATTLPTVRREIAALTRRADALARPATPTGRERARVYRLHADALLEDLADVRANLKPFGGLAAYQRTLIEGFGVPTAGLTLAEAKAALKAFQKTYAGKPLK